jgi:hypothetical protein
MLELNCTQAKLKDPQKAREVIAKYKTWFFGFEILESHDAATIQVVPTEDEDYWEWPKAIRSDEYPVESDYADLDAYQDAELDACLDADNKHFLQLLEELAPFLETPLIVLALMDEDGDTDVAVWSVYPGVKQVETLGICSGISVG